MGNCIDVLMHRPKEKIRVLMSDGGEEFNAWAAAEKITRGPYNGLKLVDHGEPHSSLPPNTRLEPGEVYYLLPLQAQPPCPPIPSRTANPKTGKRRKVKIVVTKEQ
ncbi:hypothetical protein I3842_09G105200 [Carya illinoinensis]|uniref:Uncharacterized protein n=1 Tax=Carya illinoinensis TaxID=32201 RepID=A0A922E5H8_CARIL|nr:hypothetical protein I3842_09G105200 [Carya illinoinensis]